LNTHENGRKWQKMAMVMAMAMARVVGAAVVARKVTK